MGKNCGSVTANNNCGTSQTVNCGTATSTTCTSPNTCGGGGTANVCGNSAPSVSSLSVSPNPAKGSVTFTAVASDPNNNLQNVKFDIYYSGSWYANNPICTDSTSPFTCSWNSASISYDTNAKIQATASDGSLTGTNIITFTIDNRQPGSPTYSDITGYNTAGASTGGITFKSSVTPETIVVPSNQINNVEYWISIDNQDTWVGICATSSGPNWDCSWNSKNNVPYEITNVYVKGKATDTNGLSSEKINGPFIVDNTCAVLSAGQSCGTGGSGYCISGGCCGDDVNELYISSSVNNNRICLGSSSTATICCNAGQYQNNGACVSGCTETLCSDALDNDNDGLTNCADTDCTGAVVAGTTGANCCNDGQCDADNRCESGVCVDAKTGSNSECCLDYTQCINAVDTGTYPEINNYGQCTLHGIIVRPGCLQPCPEASVNTRYAGCQPSDPGNADITGEYCTSGFCYQCNTGYHWNGNTCTLN